MKETEVGDKAEETKIDETIADETITDEESVLETVVDIDTLKEKAEKADEYLDKYQRILAEYDNFRKRTTKEKEQLMAEVKVFAVSGLIPILDSLERAEAAAKNESDENPLKIGVEMIMRSAKEEFERLGVKEIEAYGQEFDPNFHNAVMHIEDESATENTIVEVFQKGYKLGDKVIRPSMVKVAN
ncbi:MAG: nucleotide exchange factor GrpE [Bacillota bacterium]|nr:nucleotide exchange factor GrpE [Bacillota bacterium]